MIRTQAAILAVLATISAGIASAQTPAAPVERSGFAQPTPHAILNEFLAELPASRGFRSTVLATTREGREVRAIWLSRPDLPAREGQKLRVLLFAQQHGDEPSGKEALTLLLADCARGVCDDLLDRMDLVVVAQMNPDGAERHQRRTADGIDLNRSHLLLHSPEVRGLHDLFFSWMPEVTVDVHEYGSFSREWMDGGFIKTSDVQLGMLTNLNSPSSLRRFQHEWVYPAVQAAMARAGYSFSEYIVGSPADRLRHSTTEINDGRQSFGILGTLSFIQEGRKWRSVEDQLERRARSQYTALGGLLRCIAERAPEVRAIVSAARAGLPKLAGSTVITRMDHFPSQPRPAIPVWKVNEGKDTVWTVMPYHGRVVPLDSIVLPVAYVIPRELSAVRELLERHHVRFDTITKPARLRLGEYAVDTIGVVVIEEDSLPAPGLRLLSTVRELRPGDLVVPTDQWHSLFLASALEPASLWGLLKYPAFTVDLVSNGRYRILRR